MTKHVSTHECLEQLAAAALAEAERHPARSPQRRAASHLWVALTVPPARSESAARRAVRTFGTAETQQGALDLLGRLAARSGRRRAMTGVSAAGPAGTSPWSLTATAKEQAGRRDHSSATQHQHERHHSS